MYKVTLWRVCVTFPAVEALQRNFCVQLSCIRHYLKYKCI
jgi:hypothetical protein